MTDFTRIASPDDLARTEGRLVLDLEGTDIHLDWRPAPGANTIIFGFHGAIDRDNRPMPAFIGLPPKAVAGTHYLMLSDPSLTRHDQLRIGWFAGNDRFAGQRLIAALCQRAAGTVGADKAIYFGTSAGGFAALFYGWHHAGSLALVSNAHTDIASFYAGRVEAYLEHCWPGHDDVNNLPGIVTDLRSLYGQRVPNPVVFLQNNTDTFHLFNHALPFLWAITNTDDRARIATEVTYPGKMGHGPVWAAIAPWMKAALTAPSWSVEDLIETRHRIGQIAAPAPKRAPSSATVGKGFAPTDLTMAALLRDAQLNRPAKGAQ